MNNDLIENIDKIHTTPMGILRIMRNLELKTDDIVSWCKGQVKNADNTLRKGKNWYVYRKNYIITINANSFTIITAHRNTTSNYQNI